MEPEAGKDLRLLQLSLIAKIIASFTHEVKNHLAFIKESAGLIGDVMESRKSLSKEDVQQSLEVLRSIRDQIGKTSDLCNYLNRFAHRMDYPTCTFNVNESMEELVVLLHRIAHQKRITLSKDLLKDIPVTDSDPSRIQFIAFCFLEDMIKRLDNNTRIVVRTDSSRDSIRIQIIAEGNFMTGIEEKSRCSFELLQGISKSLCINLLQEEKKMTITIPRSS